MTVLQAEEVFDVHQTAAFCGISPRNLSRLVDSKAFPEPSRIGKRGRRWLKSALVEWIKRGCPKTAKRA